MKTYKVYFRHNGRLDMAFFEADSIKQIKFKVLSRFYNAVIIKIVE